MRPSRDGDRAGSHRYSVLRIERAPAWGAKSGQTRVQYVVMGNGCLAVLAGTNGSSLGRSSACSANRIGGLVPPQRLTSAMGRSGPRMGMQHAVKHNTCGTYTAEGISGAR